MLRTTVLAACLTAGPCIRAQSPQDIVQLIQNGNTAEARQSLARMEREHRSPEQTLFLKGLLTADGDSAVHIYERFLMLYPESRHGILQRDHLLRETHDFWMRNLLGGTLPQRTSSGHRE